ncbi:MAG: hypothetical protein VX438_07110 [Planctomycetota bacterium]|nr:hypothetical protein [Planctomycetota bacterium]
MENSPKPMPAQNVIDREFLEIRAKILELAASFDRINRGEGDASAQQMDLILAGLKILDTPEPNRAERVQLLFSREYSKEWRTEFKV